MAVINEYIGTKSMGKDAPKIRYIETDLIELNEYNAGRQTQESIEKLKASIMTQGLLVPICVIPEDDHYVIVSGEGRFKALQQLLFKFKFNGYEIDNGTIPCIVKKDLTTDYDFEEDILIDRFNAQKDETKNEKEVKVKKLEGYYLKLRSAGKIEKGITKRQFISEVTGYSESSVRDYLEAGKDEVGSATKKDKKSDYEKFIVALDKAYELIQKGDVEFPDKAEGKEIKRKVKNILDIIEDCIW